jgi:hypothetical protein
MTPRKIGAGQSRNIRLWDLDAPPGSTAEGLLKHYLGSLAGVDRLEAKKAELATSAELTPVGVQKQAVEFGFRELSPAYRRAALRSSAQNRRWQLAALSWHRRR